VRTNHPLRCRHRRQERWPQHSDHADADQRQRRHAAYIDGKINHALSMALDGDRIAAIYLVRNPASQLTG